MAWSNGGTISQTVGPLSVAGDTYTLTVEQSGTRNDGYANLGQTYLQIGTNDVLATGTYPTIPGNWSTYTASYYVSPANAGEQITILLSSPGVQGMWTDVALSVPEPTTSSLAFFTAGIAGVLGMLRRKFKL